MSIDFSALKEIDFSNKNNLLFLIIFLVLGMAGLIIIIIILSEIIKALKNLIRRIFNIEPRPKFNRKENADWIRQQMKEGQAENIVGKKPIGGDFSTGIIKEKQNSENKTQTYEEKTQKDIEAGLSALKSSEHGGFQVRMPSRSDGEETADMHEKIQIPVPKKVDAEQDKEIQVSERIKEEREKDVMMAERSFERYRNQSETIVEELSKPKTQFKEKLEEKPNESPDFIKNDLLPHSANKDNALAEKNQKTTGNNNSIFGGKTEISRISLREKLRKDPRIWKAEKDVGLTLSPIERAKLEKQIFSSALGRNISKNDLRVSVNKLGRKLSSIKDPKEHERVRKEIKFFKKIGGMQ